MQSFPLLLPKKLTECVQDLSADVKLDFFHSRNCGLWDEMHMFWDSYKSYLISEFQDFLIIHNKKKT